MSLFILTDRQSFESLREREASFGLVRLRGLEDCRRHLVQDEERESRAEEPQERARRLRRRSQGSRSDQGKFFVTVTCCGEKYYFESSILIALKTD